MNLRGIQGGYSIGLDMGTASVGWAVTDEKGNLLHFKRQPTWGSRLFESAKHASEARSHRGQRRRYIRCRWRLRLLQGLFREQMEKVDPDFFMRLEQSRLIEGDPIFNGSDFTKTDYYDRFPTIYHLRKWLMETDERADLRLVYLAMHNIVKHRGNFLREGQILSAKNADSGAAVGAFFEALDDWCESRELERPVAEGKQKAIVGKVATLLADTNRSRGEISEEIKKLVMVPMEDTQASKRFSQEIAKAMVGSPAEFKSIFGEFECEKTKVSLGKEEELEKLIEACPDDCAELLEALCGVHAAYLLQGLLSYKDSDVVYKTGDSISASMIAKYNQYHRDLQTLKSLVRKYAPAEYDAFFRGELYEDVAKYNYFEATGYTAYNLGKTNYDGFAKEVKKLLSGTAAEQDERYVRMNAAFTDQRFLRRLKTSDNGSIYYQLHLEELQAIIRNQARFYPFLQEESGKLESLVTFRIPYYVGPLSTKNAAEDEHGKRRFAWSERKLGMENAVITPWNWDSIIDKDKSAEQFIVRMTGDCTYLAGEKVLPKCSLLYEEYCVLNELNGMRWAEHGKTERRFDAVQREGIVCDLFRNKRTVRLRDIEDWLVRVGDAVNPHVSGSQGETSVTSKLNTYRFFAKDVFEVSELDPALVPDIEKIVLWSTLFEDRSIFEQRLEAAYGPQGNGLLNANQIKVIKKKRFAGWGRLSEKFLTGMKVRAQDGRKVSIMDVLRYGDPNSNSRQGRTMVMMEVLRNEELGFQKKVDELNREYYTTHFSEMGVSDYPGSPAIRRSLYQAMRIVGEIVKIAGGHPANVFIEVTRDEDLKNKGKLSRKRNDRIGEALAVMEKEDPGEWSSILAEFKAAPSNLDERLTLYFMQGGKCMYSGKPLDIAQLSDAGKYEIDHIIPRAYTKDDSYENKALVIQSENQRKTCELLIDQSIRDNMSEYWKRLHDVGLIGDKKFNNLKRSDISSGAMKGFIARQLVETSQMVKMVQSLLKVQYPDTNIVPVKASMSRDLRKAMGLTKCREANDFHHAHDAYLACRLGLFIQMRYPEIYENPIAYKHSIREYVRSQYELFDRSRKMPASAGFIVDSFLRFRVDERTGEVVKDAWDVEAGVESLRKALNYRQCYVARMPYEDTGKYWDAQPVSPRGSKKSLIELKVGLDPKRFGGYTGKEYSHFFLSVERDRKGAEAIRLVGFPVYLKKSAVSLEAYASNVAREANCEFVRIIAPCIRKNQLIEIRGKRYFVTALEEAKNAVQLAFSLDEMSIIKSYLESENGTADAVIDIIVRRALRLTASPLIDSVDFSYLQRSFNLVPDDKQKMIIEKLLLLFRGNKQSLPVDLSCIGGAKQAGRLRPMRSKITCDITIIDQSVTGMFERKTRVGL